MNQALTSNDGVNRDLHQIEQPSRFQQIQAPHQPGMFRSILAGVVGTAANMFAPGLGGVLGSLIGGRGSSPLGNLIGGDSSFASDLAASGYAANSQNLADANEILAIARQSNRDEEKTELASNLEKSKHQTFMAVIQNIT